MSDPRLQVQITAATPADETDLLRLKQLWEPFAYKLKVPSGEDWLILRRDGEAVAYLEGTHRFRNWDILQRYEDRSDAVAGSFVGFLFVDERARGAGLGGMLLDFFVDRAWVAGSDVVVLSVMDDWSVAARERFFRRHGFSWAESTLPGRTRLMTKTPWS